MAKVFVVTGWTESGDEFVYVFAEEPTKESLNAFFADEMPYEWRNECIQRWSISEEEVRSI
ncbi:hypothetical protein J1C56_02215 [Aminobacter anthyllidis]|uniref:Uncharacterized protein n=1 Tax=Aminobacter anthyllidis TaxID=1035067 RepID=A0A9X1D461_9HYPH|nr:hypothetical protein [Aminobacter anthyllidis]MBT1154399.1 hypothetical protein [Aminobacter anthyllidis]